MTNYEKLNLDNFENVQALSKKEMQNANGGFWPIVIGAIAIAAAAYAGYRESCNCK